MNNGSGEGQGSNQNGETGGAGGASAESSAAVDTAIRTDSAGLEATRSAIDNDTAGLDTAKAALEKNLTNLASDPEKFQAVLEKSFGGNYDKAGAEKIRQQVLNGDFSWLPNIEVVDAATLQDQSGQQTGGTALGAYSKDNDTIYISRELLASDPDKAAQILTEEVGHGLDARLNTSDAVGDEGDIFARLVGGEEISASELKALKSENDSGTIIVDGKEVEVEYGFLSKLTKPFKKAFKSIKKGVSKAWKGVKKGFKKIMNSKLLGTILSIAQFIPIPIVQLVVRGINLVKAGYAVYQGIKHKSLSMALGGVAGVASGIGSFGATLGASAGFVNGATRIANGARALGAGYSAIAKGDFGSAASLASNWFGGTDTQAGRFFDRAGKVATTVDRARRGDVIGAFSSGSSAFASFGGNGSGPVGGSGATPRTSGSRSGILNFIQDLKDNKTVRAISDNFSTVRNIVKSVREGDLSGAASSFLNRYGDGLGIDSGTRRSVERWSSVLERVSSTRTAFRSGNYPQAISAAAGLLGIPQTELNQNRIGAAFGLRDAVIDDRYPDALQLGAKLANSYGKPELANTLLSVLAGLANDPATASSSTRGGVARGEAA